MVRTPMGDRPMRSMTWITTLTSTGALAAAAMLGGCSREAKPAHAEPAAPPPVNAAAPAPASVDQPAAPVATAEPSSAPLTRDPHDYGQTQPVRPDANPGAASVAEALATKTHPERLSPLIAPKPFDLVAYQRDPAAYLNLVEPGRVFQVAQPAADVQRIQAHGPVQARIPQGGSVPLQVQAPAGMPVTFTSFDLGRFAENQLTSITVAADERGLAHATLVGAPGTTGEVNILAACPVTSGQITFRITVQQASNP